MESKSWNSDRLYKYTGRIDAAINQGRYNLALKLAYRCLKFYYRDFISRYMPEEEKENINLMSVSISKYLMRYIKEKKVPYSEKRVMLMLLVSNYLLSSFNKIKTVSSYNADRADAVYAQQNVKAIVKLLLWFEK